ncbi:hypothetical protein ZWY2020_039142 [Hordeum vulgare]|nr:hypothetical protein ZWY2020_039142 [Hordeum vulgare]
MARFGLSPFLLPPPISHRAEEKRKKFKISSCVARILCFLAVRVPPPLALSIKTATAAPQYLKLSSSSKLAAGTILGPQCSIHHPGQASKLLGIRRKEESNGGIVPTSRWEIDVKLSQAFSAEVGFQFSSIFSTFLVSVLPTHGRLATSVKDILVESLLHGYKFDSINMAPFAAMILVLHTLTWLDLVSLIIIHVIHACGNLKLRSLVVLSIGTDIPQGAKE